MDADEFWDFCHRRENEHRNLDLSDGRVIEWPRRTRWQGVLTARIGFELCGYGRQTETGYATACCGITLGAERRTVRGMCGGYFTDFDRLRNADRWDGSPPVVAVLTGYWQEQRELLEGAAKDFLRHGTAAVWVLDPHERTVTALAADSRTVLSVRDTLTCGALTDFSCFVADLFRQPRDERVSA